MRSFKAMKPLSLSQTIILLAIITLVYSCTNGSDACILCSTNSTDTCDICLDKYYLSKGSCLPCSARCKTCSQKTARCLTCYDGYYLNGLWNYCYKCSLTCNTCSNKLSNCTSCKLGNYLSNNSCYSCPVGCTNCSSQACFNCTVSYYLSNSSQCLPCSKDCNYCSDSLTCLACKNSTYLQNSICYDCSDRCTFCSNSSVCLACQPYTYLSNSSCSYCSQKCYQCINSSICLSCQDSVLQNGYCVSKSSNTNVIIASTTVSIFVSLIILIIIWKKCRKTAPQIEKHAYGSTQKIKPVEKPHLIEWKILQNKGIGLECTICIQPCDSFIQCGHVFHPMCLDYWYKRNKCCPICRRTPKNNMMTVFCEHCRKFCFNKALAEIVAMRHQEILYENCRK